MRLSYMLAVLAACHAAATSPRPPPLVLRSVAPASVAVDRTFDATLGAPAERQSDVIRLPFSGETSLENTYVVAGPCFGTSAYHDALTVQVPDVVDPRVIEQYMLDEGLGRGPGVR